MCVSKWCSYHFPKLAKLVPDNQYAWLVQLRVIVDKDILNEDKLADLTMGTQLSHATRNVPDSARGSMGSSLSDVDMLSIFAFAARAVSIAEYRKSLIAHLSEKTNLAAHSLTAFPYEGI